MFMSRIYNEIMSVQLSNKVCLDCRIFSLSLSGPKNVEENIINGIASVVMGGEQEAGERGLQCVKMLGTVALASSITAR